MEQYKSFFCFILRLLCSRCPFFHNKTVRCRTYQKGDIGRLPTSPFSPEKPRFFGLGPESSTFAFPQPLAALAHSLVRIFKEAGSPETDGDSSVILLLCQCLKLLFSRPAAKAKSRIAFCSRIGKMHMSYGPKACIIILYCLLVAPCQQF